MTARIPWDRYEVALLFSAYKRVADGADINVEAEKLSETLRALAICRGIQIDDTFRNVNGMKMQLANVQYLFTNGQKGLSGASAMIRQMHTIYRTNPTEYQAVLEEAIQMTETKTSSIEDAFFVYAKERTGLSPTKIAGYLQKAADYCHLKQPILGMTDVKAVRTILQKVSEGRLLRFQYGKDAQTIRNLTQYYYTFIKSYQAPKEESPAPVAMSEKKVAPVQTTTAIEATSIAPSSESSTVAISVECCVDSSKSDTFLPQEMDEGPFGSCLWVDFEHEKPYVFTKPISYTYKGKVYGATSWNGLYVDICGHLFTDYHDTFMTIINGDIPGYNALAFADEQHKNGMRVARCFAPGFFLESNMDATAIVRRIRGLHKLFRLGADLQISYLKMKETKDREVTAEPDEEWIIHELRSRKIPYVDNRAVEGCLWIASGRSIPFPLNEASKRGYRLRVKQDGCRAFPNRPVIWTKDRPQNPTATINPNDSTISLDAFKQFLIKEKGFSERTAGNYWTSIRMIEVYIKRNNLGFSLLNTDAVGAQQISDLLMARPDFEQINTQRHHQFSAALVQYISFLRMGAAFSGSSNRDSQKKPEEKTIIETVFDVLRRSGKPLTVSEIFQAIVRDDLYTFGAQDPQAVVYSKIFLARKQTDNRIREGRDVLIQTEEDGRKKYQVMSAEKAVEYLEHLKKKAEQDYAAPWAEYEAVLKQAFQKGVQKESGLDLKKLRKRWVEIHGKELKDSDEAVRQQLATHCVDTGKRWYLAELLLSDKDRQTVLQYIDQVLRNGKSVIYYSSIYAALEHQLESSVLTEDLLVSYLLATCQDRYFLQEHYLSKEKDAQANLAEEIKDVMISYGRPIHTDELKKTLHHLPPDQVERELHTHSDFIMDGFHMYFHESMADLTNEELDHITSFIQEEIDDHGYMIGNWIQWKLTQLYPETAERLSFLSYLGVRGAVAFKLQKRFTFSGPVITPRGKAMNMIDIFAMFCKHHTPFSLDQLSAFAKECDTMIYLDTVHSNCARVSEKEFVATDAVSWDISHVDAAIALHCPGKYISLKSIQYFDAFPFVGYPWNSYLLEQYVATVSTSFMLMHSSYAKNNTSGAIVRREAGFESFEDVLVDVLANAPVDLENQPCLEYLANTGYITRKKLSNISDIITRARILRPQKG